MSKSVKIILADDHKLFRDALKMLINSEEIGEVIAEASDGKELLALLETRRPDIVLLDISMPVMNGIEACEKAVAKYPGIRILALSMFGDEEYYYKMIDAGVKGFVLKTSGMYELQDAVKRVYEGENYFSNELLRRIILNIGKQSETSPSGQHVYTHLTARETEILNLICMGKTNDEIAEELFISPTTVKGHRRNLLAKTDSKNTASLVMYAIRNKIVRV